MRARSVVLLMAVLALAAAAAAACGGSSKSSSTSSSGGGAKGGTFLSLAQAAPSGSPDPQINYTLQEWQLLVLSHDGLVAFKRTGGTEGTKLVPDLATSIPKPTEGGKTVRVAVRKGVKCANGNELQPD